MRVLHRLYGRSGGRKCAYEPGVVGLSIHQGPVYPVLLIKQGVVESVRLLRVRQPELGPLLLLNLVPLFLARLEVLINFLDIEFLLADVADEGFDSASPGRLDAGLHAEGQ